MDPKSAERLSKVHPELKKKVEQLIKNCAALGIEVRVVQGLRTFDEQNKLYNQPRDGRDNDGDGRIDERDEKVTNARGGSSNHNYGLATDLCRFKNGQPDWNDLEAFKIIGREAKKLGLEWGGDWKFVDRPHVQLRGMSIKECLQAFNAGGLSRVWQRMYELLGGSKPQTFAPTVDEVLESGDVGDEVAKLQIQLVKLNLLRDHEIDARFGRITKNAVIGFQRQNNLTADGIVGPGTKAKLNAAFEAKSQTFQNLKPAEVAAAVEPLTDDFRVESGSFNSNVTSLNIPDISKITDKVSEIPNQVEDLIDETASQAGTLIESTTQTFETAKGQVEKTITEKTDMFNPKNLPAFIPRLGKDYLWGLIPGAGFLSAIGSYIANLPPWMIYLIVALTAIALWNFGQLIIKNREKVLDFITECYKTTADPGKDNLIPTNAAGFIGSRKNALLSALLPKIEQEPENQCPSTSI